MDRASMIASVLGACIALVSPLAFGRQATAIKADEEVELYRTVAVQKSGGTWSLRIRGHICEPEPESRWRNAAVKELAGQLGVGAAHTDQKIFRARVWPFFVDNERAKRVEIAIADTKSVMPASGENGQFEGEIELDEATLGAARARGVPGWVTFHASAQDRTFQGEAVVLTERGISVVSDIDDTIKVSHIGDRSKLIEATFLKPFQPVAGMASLYRDLAVLGKNDAPTTFHYLSASPWQLYAPLVSFLDEAGFPKGSMHLRPWRVKDSTFVDLFKSARPHKEQVIRRLIAAAPFRRFILVGDSTEEDPEIFAAIAAEFPEAVALVAIRQTPGSPLSAERAARAAARLKPDQWLLFHEPSDWTSIVKRLEAPAK